MTIKNIITNVHKLGKICEPVDLKNELYIRRVYSDLLDTATHHDDRCLGLAAPQIGYNTRMFAISNADGWVIAINPEIIRMKGEKSYLIEGCLSVPGFTIKVMRYLTIKVRYNTISGEKIERKFNRMSARIFQHELDHLNGILIQ